MQLLRRAADCPTLSRCLRRLEELRRKRQPRRTRRWLAAVIFRFAQVQLCCSPRTGAIRFVALSDTHTHHNRVNLPDGDVLLFVGDSVANYSHSSDILQHYEDFLAWLRVQSKRFDHVFLMSGNHETFLEDSDSAGAQRLVAFLEQVPNCTYLLNRACSYRGLRLFGSPVTVSRVETLGKRYYSWAFERFEAVRRKLWAKLPEDLDVLVSHCPPFGCLSGDKVGDPVLRERLKSMRAPPRFHVFGHDHEHLGAECGNRTLSLNVAQDKLLHLDPGGGGCPIVFDVRPRDPV